MSDWKKGYLSDILLLTMGQSPVGQYCNTDGEGTPLLNGPTEFGIKSPKAVQFTTDPKKMSAAGDILFCVRGSTTGRMNWSDKPYAIGRGIAAFRHTHGDEYQHFLKGTIDYQLPAILNSATGSTFPNVSKDQLLNLEIGIPPLPEQKAIASILAGLDDKIDLLHGQNRTLEALTETLFRQWFIEEALENWEQGVLPDEFEFTMGQSPPGSSFNEAQIGTPMFQGNADFGFRFPTERVFTTDPRRFAEELDTLISVRAPVGAQNMALKGCCIGRGVAAFKSIYSGDFYTYTYYKLRSLMSKIQQFNDEGTVFGSIGKKDFQKIVVTIPPNTLVQSFENEVKPLNDKIINNCKEIRTLELLRDTLLPKLISGKIKVGAS